jgi:ferredoxin
MIISHQKPYEEILLYLKDAKKIVLTGCAECATVCHAGGADELAKIKAALEADGKEILATIIPSASCNVRVDQEEFQNIADALKEADAILSMACGDGVQTVAQVTGKKTYPANNTLFVGQTVKKGVYKEMCKTCGQCMLGRTAGICPITQCGKSLVNGACGGSQNGKCEVNPEEDCAWIRIYEKLKERGNTDFLTELQPIRSYQKSNHPRTVDLKKEAKAAKQQTAERTDKA